MAKPNEPTARHLHLSVGNDGDRASVATRPRGLLVRGEHGASQFRVGVGNCAEVLAGKTGATETSVAFRSVGILDQQSTDNEQRFASRLIFVYSLHCRQRPAVHPQHETEFLSAVLINRYLNFPFRFF